ncbi:MFS transporter [Alkalibacterium olivapovliticus]|uniref:GPH family glycoside/pentoside/hexuronide:cation symporter n=1 Tax=Alkalibacterium olivapovliticus TaxID=99907 RepID=A0A2T0VUJ3_9LACT|nr:glycoside-pentoside-hexuronide (GPH):cation symporter [Alkalibacterium olivapovliticus]PRY75088.1 GPH family glycoside/pentoside/hexuronide:cation symporter [Alkalibacterium olivapovliticus]
METTHENVSVHKLNGKEKLSYGFGNLAANLLITTANAFITYFYIEQVGIAAAAVGTMLFLARFFDGVTDLGMGVLVDKTDTKIGKARPWLKWMAIPYGIAIVLLFSSPNLGETGNIIYGFITYVLAVGFIYTAATVPYNAMIGTMTMDPVERGHLSTIRTAFGYSGAWLVNVITLPLVAFYGGGSSGWTFMAITYAIVAIVLWYLNFSNTKERITDSDAAGTKITKVPIKLGLKTLLTNKYWLLIIGVMFISFVNAGISGVNPFYAQYILGNALYVGAMGTAQFVPIILMMFVVGPLMNYISKRNLVIIGACITIASRFFIYLIDPTNLTVVLIGIVIGSIGTAPMLASSFAMLGDTVDYGELKSGVRTEGLAYSAATFGEKVGSGFGGMVLGLVLGAAGYIGGQATQTEAAMNSIVGVFILIPIIFDIIAIVLMYFYDLDKKHAEILKELEEKKNA